MSVAANRPNLTKLTHPLPLARTRAYVAANFGNFRAAVTANIRAPIRACARARPRVTS